MIKIYYLEHKVQNFEKVIYKLAGIVFIFKVKKKSSFKRLKPTPVEDSASIIPVSYLYLWHTDYTWAKTQLVGHESYGV